MAHVPSRSTYPRNRKPLRCLHPYPEPIYDEPYVFQVRSNRSISHSLPCRACLREAKQWQQQQRPSTTNAQYEKRCSRFRSKSVHFGSSNRPQTAVPIQVSAECNWENFMKRKSRYAIKTPYALCDLTRGQQELENRPPFVNYGGHYNDKPLGEKRTFNSLAVHQLKHNEVDGDRIRDILRERRLRREAENYFRQAYHDEYMDNNSRTRRKK